MGRGPTFTKTSGDVVLLVGCAPSWGAALGLFSPSFGSVAGAANLQAARCGLRPWLSFQGYTTGVAPGFDGQPGAAPTFQNSEGNSPA
jgi:hypothetical protein